MFEWVGVACLEDLLDSSDSSAEFSPLYLLELTFFDPLLNKFDWKDFSKKKKPILSIYLSTLSSINRNIPLYSNGTLRLAADFLCVCLLCRTHAPINQTVPSPTHTHKHTQNKRQTAPSNIRELTFDLIHLYLSPYSDFSTLAHVERKKAIA